MLVEISEGGICREIKKDSDKFKMEKVWNSGDPYPYRDPGADLRSISRIRGAEHTYNSITYLLAVFREGGVTELMKQEFPVSLDGRQSDGVRRKVCIDRGAYDGRAFRHRCDRRCDRLPL